jgi:hypothetical protein
MLHVEDGTYCCSWPINRRCREVEFCLFAEDKLVLSMPTVHSLGASYSYTIVAAQNASLGQPQFLVKCIRLRFSAEEFH